MTPASIGVMTPNEQSAEYEQPPQGWFDFGLHAYVDVPLQFSKAEVAGIPRWERPRPPAVHPFIEDVDDASMCLCGVPASTHDQVYPPGKGGAS